MSTRKSEAGDNSDAVLRAETIREAFAELLAVNKDRDAANVKFKARADKSKANLKAMGFKAADWAPAFRIHELKAQAEDADKVEDREKAERSIKMSVATFAECYAAVEEKAQLDFDGILNDGQEARKAEQKAPEAVVKTNQNAGKPTLVQ